MPPREKLHATVPRPAWPFSIRARLTFYVAALCIGSSAILSWIGYASAEKTLREQIDRRLTAVASDRRKMLSAYIEQQQERLSLVASRTRLRQLLQELRDGAIAEAPFREEARRILEDARRG